MTVRRFTANVTTQAATYSGFTPTIYAAPTAQGNGSGSSEANATALQSALGSATAGAIIGVLPGVYTRASVSDRWIPAWQPTNSGTVSQPIRIVAKYPAVYLSDVWNNSSRTELRNGFDGVTDGSGCSTFGSYQRNYVQWYGIAVDVIRSGARTEKAPVTMNGCTGVKIHQCELRGVTANWADNWSAVRYENCDQCDVIDCRMYGFYDIGGSHSWGVLMYGGSNYEIAHNEVFDCYGGIYIKGILAGYPQNAPGRVHRNLVHDVGSRMLMVTGVNENSIVGFLDFYQNVGYVSGNLGMSFGVAANSPRNVRLVNNTIVSCSSAGVNLKPPSGSGLNGCVIQNSVFSGSFTSISSDGTADHAALSVIDRNLYASSSRVYNGNSFAQFQALGREASGAAGDPLFVNAAARDYRLQAGSPALTLGRDVLSLTGSLNAVIPAGAYITGSETIGVRS